MSGFLDWLIGHRPPAEQPHAVEWTIPPNTVVLSYNRRLAVLHRGTRDASFEMWTHGPIVIKPNASDGEWVVTHIP